MVMPKAIFTMPKFFKVKCIKAIPLDTVGMGNVCEMSS